MVLINATSFGFSLMNGLGLKRKKSRYIGDRQHSMNNGETRERTDGRTDGWADERMVRRTEGGVEG